MSMGWLAPHNSPCSRRMLQPDQGLSYYVVCWKRKHVTNPFHPISTPYAPKGDPSVLHRSKPRMSQGSNALNHKPRRIAASSKHPGKQGDMVNPQFSQVDLVHGSNTQTPPQRSSDQRVEHAHSTATRRRNMAAVA